MLASKQTKEVIVIALEDEGVTNSIKQWGGSLRGMALIFFFNKHCVETGGVDNPLKKHCTKGQHSNEVVST